MASQRQLSFLSRGPLFDERARDAYLKQKRQEGVPNLERRLNALRTWCDDIAVAKRAKEVSLESDFHRRLLGDVLGYVLFPGAGATAYVKPPKRLTGTAKEPDIVLGPHLDSPQASEPSELAWKPIAVFELKSPDTDLDAPQARESHLSPVEQAFEYGEAILGVRWVLVSDMQVIRLYSIDSRYEFVEFELDRCAQDAAGSAEFLQLYFLLGYDHLVRDGDASSACRLLSASRSNRREIRASFYRAYSLVRTDLHGAIEAGCRKARLAATPDRLLSATQRLLDRILFIRYCEDSPDALIRPGTLQGVIEAARSLPGRGTSKVYSHLKELFSEIDAGSPPESGIRVDGYNGELFKHDPILDEIDLPDSLASKSYEVALSGGRVERTLRGAFAFHEYDFWKELNEHLLGHVFEESLSELESVRGPAPDEADRERQAQRKKHAVFYTTDILSDFLATSALRSFLDEEVGPALRRKPKSAAEALDVQQRRHDRLTRLRILDPACGSGAFLVSAYQGLLEEHWRTREAVLALQGAQQRSLLEDRKAQSTVLRRCLFGADLLPQAVEIAKLALWIRSARKGEKVANLGENLSAGDSLDLPSLFARLKARPGSFDLVIGNPPWGADVSPEQVAETCSALRLDPSHPWDTWELFVALALYALRPGGRLAFVLPDTLFSPEKAATRELLVKNTRLEKVYSLGPDWFGPTVRMGTLVLQARKGAPEARDTFAGLLLHGERRRRAIAGEIPLPQLEARLSRPISQARSLETPDAPIEVFRGDRDDLIMHRMEAAGEPLSSVCDRARGDELAKSGLLWECPSCSGLNNPGTKEKGGGFNPTECRTCGLRLTARNARELFLVTGTKPAGPAARFIDGDDIPGRYKAVAATRWIRLDSRFKLKPPAIFAGEKILLRQAGIGVAATLDRSGARCPQSVYIYRANQEHASWGNSYVLGVLSSRPVAYYVFKRFGEVDPARAHAKLTHDRLAGIPIPRLKPDNARHEELRDSISANVNRLLAGKAGLGGAEDWQIEVAVRELYGLAPDDGEYINDELRSLPPSQALDELFPSTGGAAPLR